MLFYSYEFMYLFLPITLVGYFLISKLGNKAVNMWLVFCSLFFYSYWNPPFVILLIVSILVNYAFGFKLQKNRSRPLLITGISLNLLCISYYKYAGFLVSNFNVFTNYNVNIGNIFLPLAISFYTFQQIAFLVDSYAGRIDSKNKGFWRYSLFVTFFPQLIAGPIVHHKEMMPQFGDKKKFRLNFRNISIGLSIFIIGLFKKIVIADGIAEIVYPVFELAGSSNVSFLESWIGASAYTLQVYFDFSGYSDMAIGLARMFNIKLPLNFNSPLKATSITEFWRRWHMTMTRFFTDYVFNPISMHFLRRQIIKGGKGDMPLHLTTFINLTLIGLWHGANWNYIFFGIMHGVFLVVHRLWIKYYKNHNRKCSFNYIGVAITFIVFSVSSVMFRTEDLKVVASMYRGMFGFNEFIPGKCCEINSTVRTLIIFLSAIIIAFVLPNTHQIMHTIRPVCDMNPVEKIVGWQRKLLWRPSLAWSLILMLFVIISIVTLLDSSKIQDFIYFQF